MEVWTLAILAALALVCSSPLAWIGWLLLAAALFVFLRGKALPVLAGKRVLDYGSGSGILAVAALKLGAREAVAVDNDPQAVRASRENAINNCDPSPANT